LPLPRLPRIAAAGLVAVCVLVALSGCSKRPDVQSSKYMSQGEDAVSKGHIREAVTCFEKEIELNPRNAAPYLKLALIYEHVHRDAAKADEYYAGYFERETNDARKQRVEKWHKELDNSLLDVPSLPLQPTGNGDAALMERIEELRRKLGRANQTNEELAGTVIQLEGLQDQLRESQETAKLLVKERDDLQAQARTESESLASIKKTLDELRVKHDAATKTSSQQITALEAKIAALETRNEELEQEGSRSGRRTLAKKLDEARVALKAAEQKNETYARQVRGLERTIAQLKAADGGTTTTTTRRTVTHTVQAGETLRGIALKYYGTKERWEDIYKANRSTIPSPHEIKLGQKLIIPLDESQ